MVVLVAGVALFASGCSSCGKKAPPADWVAAVATLTGDVRVRPDGSKPLAKGRVGQFLRIGARLETGPNGEAHLRLRNGGALTVKPNSVVTLSSSAPAKRLHLTLARGSVVGRASKIEASDLVIGVGKRRVRLSRQAKATVAAGKTGPEVVVDFGQATVEGPKGNTTVVAGKALSWTSRRAPDAGPAASRADAGKPDASSAGAVQAPEMVFFLKVKRGRVWIKQPGKRRRRVRRGEIVRIEPGTELTLARRARVVVGDKKGKGTTVTGPARLKVEEGPPAKPGGAPSVRLRATRGALRIARTGKPGAPGSSFEVDGVKLLTRVRHRRIDVRVTRDSRRRRTVVAVRAGEATLVGKGGSVKLEAGQRATIRKGAASGPLALRGSAVTIRRPGTLRVFVPGRRVGVTLRWKRPAGAVDALVEVARNRRLRRPLFADRITRQELTLSRLSRGVLYWRVRPVNADGSYGKAQRGRLLMIRDTSYRRIRTRPPRNTIHLSDKDTVVYYQNAVPRFTFRWPRTRGARYYRVKIMRESNLGRPLVNRRTRRTSLSLRTGRLAEGSYLWYVSARGRGGALVKASKERRLSVRYDNATPDLQIKHPRDGLRVSSANIEVRGVTIRGSKVFVNGAEAGLDGSYRFKATVALAPGVNVIKFVVVDKRKRSSVYVRRVTRQ